jgi:divalent metal cation (Fe/Co/Zn/Cd) transporter
VFSVTDRGDALPRAGRRHRSITLIADGRHLLTDGHVGRALVGVALVAIDWELLDPIVALPVGVNILVTGYGVIRRSVSGILDAALPAEDIAAIESVLDRYRRDGIEFHAIRTRESGRQRFMYIHVLVPDEWTANAATTSSRSIKSDLAAVLTGVVTFTHVEPRGDPASYGHESLHPRVPHRTQP